MNIVTYTQKNKIKLYMNVSDMSYHNRQLGKKRKKKTVILQLSSLRPDSMPDFTK